MRLAALITTFAILPAVLSAQTVGLRESTMPAPHHDRDMGYAVWYPAIQGSASAPFGGNPIFEPNMVALNAAPADGRYPLVVLSHGLGGHYRSLGWLAAGLAQSGAVVVGVNHPNSTVFDFDMQTGLEHWTRAQDLSRALDDLLADPVLGGMIDPGRISALGFSYGGWTALSLGGVRGNLAGYISHCDTTPSRHCADITRAGSDLRMLDAALWDGDHADPRITRVVAIDPGLSFGLNARDVAGLDASTLLIQLGAGADRLDATDVSADGSNLSGLLPQADLLEIAPAAHFSVLPLCTAQGAEILEEENDDPVCTDPEGADRATIHAQVLAATRAHLWLE
ncbi:alpha/beta hydrolase family protein [Roseinatronobacter monicus]|uniref:Putative dienelactone hydrolase n=1 Tax=Roseinatronobacter monicus TaxID=393481 RepID=A0A543K4A4_9RHOB|nr:hypothetical protein [Roseinatronobacter monicus]TQM89917.1 putative dienelactone hydrolase [Roseinatronobacter monicus]